MITFYPGPSKVYPEIEHYLSDAYKSGILSVNHRSEPFMKMLKETIETMKLKLEIPADYEVYFCSSATECWEIIAQSLVETKSLHVFNGAFGEKWMEYTQKIKPASSGLFFDLNSLPKIADIIGYQDSDAICLTHNETSNGTALPDSFFEELRKLTEKIITVDATSSMAGVVFPWKEADVWYASVQKCFGLPAGLSVMIVSPKAVQQAEKIGERDHYNSLLFVRDNFLKYQTPYTPNALGIYLAGRVMQQVEMLSEISVQMKDRAKDWYQFLSKSGYKVLVENEEVRSDTVIAVSGEKQQIAAIKKAATENGIMLGNGYGSWKETSFRIANFPAITLDEINQLKVFLKTYSETAG
ncbi:aminotransferase class V-fold PLP-dependent enzyme [Dyadobacter frigoris]|uniref:phosphoserine transaminase n=1 Tax=Dyadobacter frigoris TaxID=2576211 RepID=A0A4U6D692_9BACT|nr:aminotransferase class V-fold PLP-dependent enzyme [Dyadobacter frigoris]TKT92890.1 aminotransferase class V-fold PLP-dependent enzyme [Dyadobacter frigoris]GLU54335.1 phosphoserine aminotransferase [Dyadobacter frigoris]